MAGGAGQPLLLGIETMLVEEAGRSMIERLPGVGVTFAAVGHFHNFLGMYLDQAGRVGARMEDAQDQRNGQYDQ